MRFFTQNTNRLFLCLLFKIIQNGEIKDKTILGAHFKSFEQMVHITLKEFLVFF